MIPMRIARTCLGVSLLAALVACKKDGPPSAKTGPDDPVALAQDGTESAMVENDAQLLTSSLVSAGAGGAVNLATFAGGDLDAQDVGDGAKLIFLPRGCLAVVHDSAAKTVTYTFNGCSGPNGIFRLQGEVKATYTTAPGALTLQMTATALRINRAQVDWAAKAEFRAEGAKRTMHWTGQLAGSTARGRTFGRSSERTVRWSLAEPCLSLEGSSQGDIDGRNLQTTIAGFRRCRASCPDAGGTIAIKNLTTGRSVMITFDGTTMASVDTGQRVEKVDILCAN